MLVSLDLTEGQAEELLVALALRRKQLGNSGYSIDLADLMRTLNDTFTAKFGWQVLDRTDVYFKGIKSITLRKGA